MKWESLRKTGVLPTEVPWTSDLYGCLNSELKPVIFIEHLFYLRELVTNYSIEFGAWQAFS